MPVVGKIDTGACRTMLNLATGRAIGIDDPAETSYGEFTALTATSAGFRCYVHRIVVQVTDYQTQNVFFPIQAAVAPSVSRNLFGLDWIEHMCIAVDSSAVHFLVS